MAVSVDMQAHVVSLNHKVRDDVFDVDLIAQYILCLQAGNDSFRFCVVDAVFKKCLWIEDYSFQAVATSEHLIQQLEMVYHEHPVLRAGFWKEVKLTFRNQFFTLLPIELFTQAHISDFLRLSTGGFFSSQDVAYHQQPDNGPVSIYLAESKLVEWFKKSYSLKNVSVTHQISTFIEGVLQQKIQQTSEWSMSVLVERNYLTIVVTQQRQLEFCNTFTFQNEKDFVYFILLVMDGLGLNPNVCQVFLYGEITENAGIFTSLFKYVRFLQFGGRPSHLRFSYKFDDVLDHRYFDLYNIYLS
jgi:hypothetical protein